MDDDQFRQLLDRFNFSWSGYRKVRKGVKKRLSRHMQELNCPNFKDYLERLNKNNDARKECERRMTVSISRFFRDRKLWLDLEHKILPTILNMKNENLKVWSAGCARGEEVYSFKIIWNRLKSIYGKLPVLEMTATDINANYIKQAKAGIYTKSSLKEVSEEIRKFYFEIKKSGNRFDVRPFLKKNINWKVQDIFADPPEPTFHIILLRNNLLTYYQEHLKMEGLNNVIKTLAPEAWLIVGSQEKIPNQASNLIRHPSIPWAYRMEVHNGGRKIPTDG